MSRKLDLVIRCSGCKGTLIWQEQNGEVIVFHNCKGIGGTPATPSTQSQPKCNCGAGDDAYLATHALDCSLRKWGMSPQTVMPAKIFDPKELAGRIAKRVFDEDWKCIEAEKTELLSLDELRAIIEQELTR